MSHTYDMTTNDRSITEQLPDLPALESAEAGTGQTWPAVVVIMGMLFVLVGVTIWMAWTWEPYLGKQLRLV